MAGRPRKSVTVHKGNRSKEERLNRKIQESKIKVDRLQLEEGAPDWLSPEAAEEYMRIVHEAGKINLLDNIDRAFLAIYADNYSRYVTASKELQENGLTVMTESLCQDCKRRSSADSSLLHEAGTCGDRPLEAHCADGNR